MSATAIDARPRSTTHFSIVVALACAAALGLGYQDGLVAMWNIWSTSEEFSHGPLIPVIAAFLVWQKRYELGALPAAINPAGAWSGLVIVTLGAVLNVVGTLATLHVLQQYAFLLTLLGLTLTILGSRGTRIVWAPLLLLWMMVPLPNFFLNNLSANLQLLSSQLGVQVIRLFGISVFVEGNVIDLGAYRLQVAEACSGLRYLFPLLTLGFVMAYFFKVALWKRVVLLLSTIPITILMNSFRIGVIGVMVEHWGTSMAEGFLHEFQGWAIFMVSGVVLILEMALLARIGKDSRHWREVFGLELVSANGRQAWRMPLHWPLPMLLGTGLLAAVAATMLLLPPRVEIIPARESLVSFPTALQNWAGRRDRLDAVYVDALKFDDYLLADFHSGEQLPINFYIAWYDSQRAGQSAHSPRTCLPGGGWRIVDLQNHRVAGVELAATPLMVNRALIVNGQQQQLVYYWFQQRGRVVTNEYMVKWYLFWDSLMRNRTDGALVRLIAPVPLGATPDAAEKSLTEFLVAAAPELSRYIPN